MANRSKEVIRRTMQAIKSKDTKIEILVRKALWAKGYRYRKNDNSVLGSPDITFKRHKIAIFCDSEFWHGKDWDVLKQRLNTNSSYWHSKIERNINRDKNTNQQLESNGWLVLRFWEKDIMKNLDHCVLVIEKAINGRK